MIGFPKPQRRLIDRVAYKRDINHRSQLMRDAVWKRDEHRCRNCHRIVFRTLDAVPNRGEVHHRRGRNVAPEDRYNPDKAVLLCLMCHGNPDVIARFRGTT